MTPELQAYYENRADMMQSDAWRDLIADLQGMREATDKLSIVKSTDDLWFRKGELSILDWMLNLQDMSEKAYAQLKEDDEGA
jgi:hypothetical protein